MKSSVIKARTRGLQRFSRKSLANMDVRRPRFPLRLAEIPKDRSKRVRGLWGLSRIRDRAKRTRWRADAERFTRTKAFGSCICFFSCSGDLTSGIHINEKRKRGGSGSKKDELLKIFLFLFIGLRICNVYTILRNKNLCFPEPYIHHTPFCRGNKNLCFPEPSLTVY